MKDSLDMTDDELADLSRAAAGLRPRVRDMVRESVASARMILEATGCRTPREALRQMRIWKGKADGHPDITGN